MTNPSPNTLMTFADAARLDADETPGDLVEGTFVPVTKSTLRHGRVLINIGTILKLYSRSHPGWIAVGGDPGCKLSHDPDTLRGPDVALVRKEREPTGRGEEGWLEGAPDVVVEVFGDSQSVVELLRKAAEFLAAGAKLVWLVDPDRERVLICTPGGFPRQLGPDDVLDGGDVLPGFSCSVAEFFE